MAEQKIGFALAIEPQTYYDGEGNYIVRSENQGLEEEAILTVLRNWLKKAEHEYEKRTGTPA